MELQSDAGYGMQAELFWFATSVFAAIRRIFPTRMGYSFASALFGLLAVRFQGDELDAVTGPTGENAAVGADEALIECVRDGFAY